jgi:hypothetical protein
MKSIIGNAVSLSVADVRFHPYVLPADTLIYSHVAKKGEGVGRAIGNAGCVCGILMAVLVNPCACGFVRVFPYTRARARVYGNTRFYSFPWSMRERVMANM